MIGIALEFGRKVSEALAPHLINMALKGTVGLVLAGVGAALARRSSAAVRHFVWMLGLVGAASVPILSMLLPGWNLLPATRFLAPANHPTAPAELSLQRPIMASEARQPDETASRGIQHSPTTVAPPLPEAGAAPLSRHEATGGPQWAGALIGFLWLVGVGTNLVPLAVCAYALRRTARRSRPVESAPWMALLNELRQELGLSARPLLLAGEGPCMPMTWGVFRPKILLPSDYESWPRERRRIVLLHELAHVKRRDGLSDLLARLVCAAYWFHPLAWLALVRMRDLRERACDDMVLGAGSDAPTYVEHLLAIVASNSRPLSGGIAMARSARISSRLEAVLDERKCRCRVGAGRAVVMVAIAAAVALPLAMVRGSQARPADPPASQATATLEGDVTEVDGKPVANADVSIVLIQYVTNSLTLDKVETLRKRNRMRRASSGCRCRTSGSFVPILCGQRRRTAHGHRRFCAGGMAAS